MIGSCANNAHKQRGEKPETGFALPLSSKNLLCLHKTKNSNQTCRRKKAGNFPAAASYTRFPKGSPRPRL
jgi:hypothetical protein